MTSDYFETGLLYFVLGLCVLANLVTLVAAVGLIATKQKNRDWESPWVLIVRCFVTLTVVAAVLQGYRNDLYGAFAALILFVVLEIPQTVYVILNDRKYTLAKGEVWKWL